MAQSTVQPTAVRTDQLRSGSPANRVYIVVDGSTGDLFPSLLVARELRAWGFDIYGVFDGSAKVMLEHMGFQSEIAAGHMRFADVNYARILQEANLSGSVRGQLTFLSVVSSILRKTVPRLLEGWAAMLSELAAAGDLQPERSLILGNDVGATWLPQLISLYLGPDIIKERFISLNPLPWSPGPDEMADNPTPHLFRLPMVRPDATNRLFRRMVSGLYARLGEDFAQQHARERGLDPAHIAHYDDVIDRLHRHYTYDRLLLTQAERQRQERLGWPLSIGGYTFDQTEYLASLTTADALATARAEDQKVITVALGSMTGNPDNQRIVLDRVLNTCLTRQDVRIVLSGGYAETIIGLTPEQQKRVTLVPFENYFSLFTGTRVAIISAGVGTLHHAMATGKPVICITTLPDQGVRARWAQDAGLSPGFVPYLRVLNGHPQATEAALRRLIDAALDDPRYAQAGRQLSQTVERDGLANAITFTRRAMQRMGVAEAAA